MLFASAADVAVVALLAVGGVLVTPLPPAILGMLALATLVFALALDCIERAVFER